MLNRNLYKQTSVVRVKRKSFRRYNMSNKCNKKAKAVDNGITNKVILKELKGTGRNLYVN